MPVVIAVVISSSLTCSCIGRDVRGILVMEEANSREGHGDVVLVARFDDMIVANRPTGLRHIANAAAMRPFNVVAKGEEGVRT